MDYRYVVIGCNLYSSREAHNSPGSGIRVVVPYQAHNWDTLTATNGHVHQGRDITLSTPVGSFLAKTSADDPREYNENRSDQ
jgi:hypothetical protein